MKPSRIAIRAAAAILIAGLLIGAYQYYYTCSSWTCISYNYTDWTFNGFMPSSFAFGDGSAISNVNVPDASSEYEVKTTMYNTSPSAVFVHYLKASMDARLRYGWTCEGSFYAVTFGIDWAHIWQCVGGSLAIRSWTWLGANGNATWQSVMTADGTILAYRDSVLIFKLQDTTITSGKPGIGGWNQIAGYSAFSSVQLGPLDRIAPTAVNPLSLISTPFPAYVDLQWGLTSDDANGTGVTSYQVFRNGSYLGEVQGRTFTDSTVSPGTTYSYAVRARDFHNNLGANTSVSVTTPPTGAVDARRTGVRPDGAYWGGAGEQIDVRSGNLNFTLPLVKAEGRGGWGVSFALTYNSQNWRKDNGMWKLGQDVGYGFGWRLLAGSLTPVFSDIVTVHHYIFTDSTGAEYRLNVNTGGVWTSRESNYLMYDANQAKLFFTDGSAWEFNCLSGGSEQDAGVRYPTRMEDSSGNFVDIGYKTGIGALYSNSSARISYINDVRKGEVTPAYSFTYNADAIPHLIGITNSMGTAEAWTLTYMTSATLYAPFSPQTAFGTAQMLHTVARNGVNLAHAFEYGTNGAGEMSRVVLPFQGEMRWTYGDFAYAGGRTYREVVSRQLVKQSGATATTYPFTRPAGDSALYVHSQTLVDDPGGQGQRAWNFVSSAGFSIGLLASYEQRQMPGSVVKAKDEYTWTQDSNQRPYISAVLSTIDPGAGLQKQSKTEQTLDVYGNVTQTKQYAFGNLVTPARTYTNTYVTTGNYPTYHLHGLLATSQVTDGTTTVTLASNGYDQRTLEDLPTSPTQWNASHAGPPGLLTTATAPGGVKNIYYDKTGNVTYADDNNGHSVDYTASQAANYARTLSISPNGNSSMAETFAYGTGFLGLTQDSGPNGMSQTVSYDSYGRPSQTTSPDGAVTNVAYTNSPPTQTVTTNGHWVKTTYDGLGRTIKVERGDGTGTKSIVETEYDSCACTPVGKTKRVSQPYAPGGTVYWTTNGYDGLGRTVTVTHADGSMSAYSYSGNTVTATDPAGKWKTYESDAFGNVTKTTEPNPAGGANLDTTFSYNLLNAMTQVQMTRGAVTQTRTWSYNMTTLRLSSETHPETGTTSYTYNADGSLASKNLANGKSVGFGYDSYGRVLSINSSVPCESTWFSYDDVNHNAIGRLWKVSYGYETCATVPYQFNEETTFTASGNISQKRMYLQTYAFPPWTSAGINTNYGYNNEGQVTSLVVARDGGGPSDSSYTYTYDTLGRLQTMSGNSTVSNVTYNAADQVLSMTHDGVQETRQYNQRLQLTRITVPGQMDLEYRYPASTNNGQITSMKNWINGEEVSYGYDALGRLSSAVTTGPEWGLSFGYDGFGNKTSQTVTKGSAPSMSIAVDGSDRIVGHTYDAAGNTTAMPGMTSMTWDAMGRMQQAQVQAGPTDNYAYDPSNQRVWKNNRMFVRGIDGSVLAEYTFNPSTKVFSFVQRYGYFAGKRTGQKEDRVGTVQNGSRYYPYGEESPVTGNDTHKFGTYYRDASTNLDYAVNRYYSNNMGRFMSADPSQSSADATSGGSWNRYAYAGGDPVNSGDPSGLATILYQYTGMVQGPTYAQPLIPVSGMNYGVQIMWGWAWQNGKAPVYIPILISYIPYITAPPPTPIPAPAPYGPVLTNKSQAGDALRRAIQALDGKCLPQMNTTRESLLASANRVAFWDARPAADGYRYADTIAAGAAHFMLKDLSYGSYAFTLNKINGLITNNVVLRTDFFGQNRQDQDITLVHELLHYHFGMYDDPLAIRFGIAKPGVGSSPRITEWLKAGCDKAKLK